VSVVVDLEAPQPSAFGTRLGAAARAALYFVLGVPLGAVYLLVLIPALIFWPTLTWRLAELERRLANRLLLARIPALPVRPGLAGRPGARSAERRMVGFLAVRLPAALLAVGISVVPLGLTYALLRYGIEGLAGTTDRYVGPWRLEPLAGFVLCLLSVPAAVVSIAALDWLGAWQRALARRLLSSRASASGAVREALAESIGDRTLTIAYWVPEREAFVDEHGIRVELPAPGSGRAWTAVEDDGRPVAAIIHDAELDARPELVRAAATGSVMALENERLKAELRARVEDLRASRTRIVEASMDARRRLERDLHDGAQQRLVALSLELHVIKSRTRDADTTALLDRSLDNLAAALEELRELARGIHPAILSDRGLEDALTGLAERASLPVDCDFELDERPAPAVEAAAYFVVAEALTNVTKYAQATAARVGLRRSADCIEVEVVDDGVGGADPASGSGLRGLEDRVAALGGRFKVESNDGSGTRVFARLPLV
jgi:signal transduction histidine kinase